MAIKRSTGAKSKRAKVSFSEEFQGLKKRILSQVEKILIEGFSDTVKGTPVLTGYAQSHWRVSFGKSRDSGPNAKDGGPYRSEFQVLSDGEEVIKTMKKYFFDDLRFVNTAPYINELEQGSSSKNQFFIKKAVMDMQTKLKLIK